jgi:hypothetical protein
VAARFLRHKLQIGTEDRSAQEPHKSECSAHLFEICLVNYSGNQFYYDNTGVGSNCNTYNPIAPHDKYFPLPIARYREPDAKMVPS